MTTTIRRSTLISQRPLRAMALAVGATLVLTSCGSDPSTSSASTTPTTTSSSSVAAAAEDSAARGTVATPASLKFSATTVGGEAFEGASVAGKPTVFWFWAPWCATCRAQISGVSDLAAQFGDDVAVVGVGALDAPEAIAEFAGTVPGDVIMLSDPDGAVWRHFEVTAQSTYVVLDASGEQQASGFIDTDTLVSTVSSLVSG